MFHQLIIPILFCAFALASHGQTNTWRGITPLVSDRADVEKIFGLPNAEKRANSFDYRLSDATFTVEYSRGDCDGGWEVPRGTVLSLSVLPFGMANKSARELALDRTKFYVKSDDASYGTWTDPEAGIAYKFAPLDHSLESVRYLPKRLDNTRRCNGFPPFAPESQYHVFENGVLYDRKIGREASFDRFAERLFNLRSFLRGNFKNGEYVSYALIYFDSKMSISAYRRHVERVRKSVERSASAPTEKVVFIEGGMRNTNEFELYLLPAEWKPPVPEPTLPSPQFWRKPGTTISVRSR